MWVIPKENPEGRAFITVIIVFLVFAALLFTLRIWARHISKASLNASDYTCFLSLVLDVGLTVIIWGTFSHGWGQNISNFTLEDAKFSASLFVAIDIVWNATVTSVRVSIMLFYIQIFSIKPFRQICRVVIGFNLASLLGVMLTTGLICTPIAYSYNRTIPGGHCGDLNTFERYTAISNLLFDAAVVVLPMPILWKLQMHTRRKIGLSIIFGMGAIICILTLTRVLVSAYYDLDNNTKQNAIVSLITGLEPVIGVINACLPFLPAVFHRISSLPLFLTLTDSFRSTNTSTTAGSNSKSHKPKADIMSSGLQVLPRAVGKGKASLKELPSTDTDMELNLLHQAYLDQGLQRDYTISGGSLGSAKVQDEETGIQVRKDFFVTSDC